MFQFNGLTYTQFTGSHVPLHSKKMKDAAVLEIPLCNHDTYVIVLFFLVITWRLYKLNLKANEFHSRNRKNRRHRRKTWTIRFVYRCLVFGHIIIWIDRHITWQLSWHYFHQFNSLYYTSLVKPSRIHTHTHTFIY